MSWNSSAPVADPVAEAVCPPASRLSWPTSAARPDPSSGGAAAAAALRSSMSSYSSAAAAAAAAASGFDELGRCVAIHSSPSSVSCMAASVRDATLLRHGTLRVTRNCLSLGKWLFRRLGSPDSQAQVGQRKTSWSPAATNSSGVRTPRSRKADSLSVGVAHSRTPRRKLAMARAREQFTACSFLPPGPLLLRFKPPRRSGSPVN
mmetsp:Transcript_23825/g.69782  ORF Transcript_23825/g.69782 Transcript_23825/m.69782 type:complete len:205 (+) Transcript_23825:524-1138(+)